MQERGLQRLIWLPKETRSAKPEQQAFIDTLHQDAQAQFGADLVAGDIEELRAAIHATLKKIEQPEPVQPQPDAAAAPAAAAKRRKAALLDLRREGSEGQRSPAQIVQTAGI